MKYFLNTIIGILSIALLMFLYHKTQLLDTNQHNAIIYNLQEIKQLDVTWTENVLSSRLSLNNNYDNLATITNMIEQSRNHWLAFDILSIYGKHSEKEDKQKKAYLAVLGEKAELIEQFKGVNAILSNSVRYFPTAITELKEFTQSVNNPQQILEPANKLLGAVLEYSLVSDSKTRTQIYSIIATLQATNVTDEDLIEQIDIISSHARNIVKYKQKIEVLLEQITTLNMASKLDALTETYIALQDSRLRETEPYRQALIIFSVILLLWIAYIAHQLRLTYKALDVANKTLEKRVEERTKALSDALRDLKESQSQLIQSEKMASLGQMVAGVTHEINTPLGYIKGNIQLIQSLLLEIKEFLLEHAKLMGLLNSDNKKQFKVQLDIVTDLITRFDEEKSLEDAKYLLNDSIHGLEQISELVLNLKNFSRLDLAKVSNIDLHECLDSSLMIAKSVLENKVIVEKQYGNIPKVKCSPSQINQVFLNLFINAAQAIEGKGNILIKTSVKNEDVITIIQDNGKGIPDNILSKIFDPFFSTKKVGEGTGVGLSIVYKIIQQHGGNIEVTSELGKGTKFIVSLPINAVETNETIN